MDKPTEHKGDQFELHNEQKWTGQEVGVNSNVPLVDEGKGKPYIIRQFEFQFNPDALIKIRKKKMPVPTKQELFNSNWRQMEVTLWGDGLVVRKDVEPRMIIGKRKYKVILLCEPRLGTMVAERPQTLQEITKPVVDR